MGKELRGRREGRSSRGFNSSSDGSEDSGCKFSGRKVVGETEGRRWRWELGKVGVICSTNVKCVSYVKTYGVY